MFRNYNYFIVTFSKCIDKSAILYLLVAYGYHHIAFALWYFVGRILDINLRFICVLLWRR